MVLKREPTPEELAMMSPEARAALKRIKYLQKYAEKRRSYYREKIKPGLEELIRLGIWEPKRRRSEG